MVFTSESEKEWTIREYREGDVEQILELRGIALSSPRNKQWWQWMFRDAPCGPANIRLAVTKERIIGQIASICVMIKIGNNTSRGVHGIDLMVHPDYRRQGIFRALGIKGKETPLARNISITYGTPNDQSRPGFTKHLGDQEICEVPTLTKVIDWGSVLKRRYKLPMFAGKLLGYVCECITRYLRIPKDANIEVEEIFSFDERINQFWEKASKLKNIMIVKDMKYLNWRYVAKPGHEYRIFMAKIQDEIAGFIIIKLENAKQPHGYIVDLLTLPNEIRVAEILISKAIQFFKEIRTETISCWMLPDTPYYVTLRKMGFIRRQGTRLCSKVIDPKVSKDFIANPANWYYVMGDDDAL